MSEPEFVRYRGAWPHWSKARRPAMRTYDDWKLATPPEYETLGPEPEEEMTTDEKLRELSTALSNEHRLERELLLLRAENKRLHREDDEYEGLCESHQRLERENARLRAALEEIRDNRYPSASNRSIAARALSPE